MSLNNTQYSGNSFLKALDVSAAFPMDPIDITPLELLEWALTEGGWNIYVCPYTTETAYEGPCGPQPIRGTDLWQYNDRDQALMVMRQQFALWSEDRDKFLQAYQMLTHQESQDLPGDNE